MVTIRHFTREDAELLPKSLFPGLTASEASEMIGEWNTGVYNGRAFEMFAILSEGKIIGYVSLYEHSRSVASAGAEVMAEERGKGAAESALRCLMRYAAERNYKVILDQVRRENRASIRLHEKLGFESDGYVYRNQRDQEVVLYLKLLEEESGRAEADHTAGSRGCRLAEPELLPYNGRGGDGT